MLGTTPALDEERDAVHIGILPVYCGETKEGEKPLFPGDEVGVELINNKYYAKPAIGWKSVGVVDPFLSKKAPLVPGQRFYILMNPQSLYTIKHHWWHHNVPEVSISKEQEEYSEREAFEAMTEFCERVNITFDEALLAGDAFIASNGKEIAILRYDTPEEVSAWGGEYWKNWSILRRKPIPEFFVDKNERAPFDCSC